MRKRITVAGLLLAFLFLPCAAEKFVVLGNKTKKTYEFKGDDTLNVAGNHNDLTVTGSGDSVQVNGNHNTLTVDANVKSIQVLGNQNDVVLVKKDGRKTPVIRNLGNGNRVK